MKGDTDKRPADNKDPTVILLFGWMDAKIAHLAKFSAGYKIIFPYSSQIVVASKAEVFLLPKSVLRSRLQPVVDLCTNLGAMNTSSTLPRILTHTLSNGGSTQLNYLSQIWPQPQVGSKPIPSAVILDSNPGGDDIASALHVFSTTIPNPFLRYPFFAFLLVVHVANFLLGLIPWNMHDVLRKAVSSPQWLPWSGKHTPFLYIYSRADKSVPYRHIQAVTETAESKGQDVTRVIFESSGHVSHMRSDPDRYWGAVRAVWAKALSNAD